MIVGTARPHSSDEFEWKEECDKWAKFVREMGGFERDGKLHANFVNGSSYAQKFSHEWISNKRVSEFIKGIDELIFLSCEVFYVEGYEKGKRSSVKVLSDFLGEFSPKTVRKEF